MNEDKYLYFVYRYGNLQLVSEDEWEQSWLNWWERWKEDSEKQGLE